MKLRFGLALCSFLGIFAVANGASAQTFAAGNGTASIPSTNNSVQYSYTAGASVSIADVFSIVSNSGRLANVFFQIFDPTTSTFVDCAAAGTSFTAGGVRRDCFASGRLRLEETSGGVLPSFANNIFRVRYDVVPAATPGTENITFRANCVGPVFPPACSEFTNTSAVRVTGTLTPGTITVAATSSPTITYTPPPGTTIAFGSGPAGSTATLNVTADGTGGTAGQSVSTSCAVTGTGLSLGTVTPSNPFVINSGDPPGDIDATIPVICSYAAGTPRSGTLTCTETPTVGAVATRTWPITCPAGGAAAPTATYTPPAGSTITFTGPAATVVTRTIAVTQNATGAAGTSFTVDRCAISGPGSASFNPTVTGQPIVFTGGTAGQSGTLGVSCTIPAATANATLTCQQTTNDGTGPGVPVPVSFALVCQAPSPQYTSTPPPGSTIGLTGAPGTSVSGAVNVRNTGLATLTVTGCTITGTGATGFSAPVAPGPIAPGGNGNITFSCTAPAQAGTTVTATLTCATNDPALPSVSYPLACTSLVLSIPAVSAAGKGLMMLLVLSLGLIGFGLHRRTA